MAAQFDSASFHDPDLEVCSNYCLLNRKTILFAGLLYTQRNRQHLGSKMLIIINYINMITIYSKISH